MPGDAQNVMPEGPSPEEISILINTGIHSPLTGLPDEARPVWAWILTNDYFRLQYGEALRSLVSGYFESGKFDAQADALYQMLLPYVEMDPTAFYTAEEFTLGYQMFKDFCRLRAQSIRAQLDGKLSPITFNQNAEDRIDASGLDMAALGTPLHDTPVAQ